MEKNKKFIDTLLVTGSLNGVTEDYINMLKDSDLDLLKISNKFKEYISNNRKVLSEDVEKIYNNTLGICVSIKNGHECEDFEGLVDKFLEVYKLNTDKPYDIDEINKVLDNTDKKERYKINFDSIKIHWNHAPLSMDKIPNSDLLPVLKLNDGTQIYGEIKKGDRSIYIGDTDWVGIDDDYTQEWVWVKSREDIFKLIIKRDYDEIYFPYMTKLHKRLFIHKFDKSKIRDNDECLDFIKIFDVFSDIELYKLSTVAEKKILGCKYRLVETMIKLCLMDVTKVAMKTQGFSQFMIKLVDMLEDIEDENYAMSRIKLLNEILDSIESKIYVPLDYVVKDVKPKLQENIYNDIDSWIAQFKIILIDGVSEVKTEKINKIKAILIGGIKDIDLKKKDAGYIMMKNGSMKKTKHLEVLKKALKDDRVYFVIVSSEIEGKLIEMLGSR